MESFEERVQKLLEGEREVSTAHHPGLVQLATCKLCTPSYTHHTVTHYTLTHPHTHTLSKVSLVNHRARLAAEFESSPAKKVIENRLFRFLHYNSNHLPMYAKPDMI